MKIGNYEVPEIRLIPNAVSDVKKIYDVIKNGQIETKEIGNVFGYKDYATGVFYRRLNALLSYGLLERLGSSTYKVTELGSGLSYPEPEKENIVRNKAILFVSLWNELFKKFGKNPPLDTFWIQLKNITSIEPPEAQKLQNQIRKWYMDDISLLTLDPLGHPITDNAAYEDKIVKEEKLGVNSVSSSNQIQPQFTPPRPVGDPSTYELIQFDKVTLSLPKKDLRKHYEKLQKYMKIYLEDYKEPKDSLQSALNEAVEDTTTETMGNPETPTND